MMKMKILSLREILKRIFVQLKEVQDLHNNQVIFFLLVFLQIASMKLIKFAEQFPKNIPCVGNLQLPLVTPYLFLMNDKKAVSEILEKKNTNFNKMWSKSPAWLW